MIESETREFKKGLSELKEGLVSVAAVLNKHGEGELWFGIRNDGEAAGLDVNEKTLRDVSQAIVAHIEPRIYPQITARTFQGAKCIHIAFAGNDAPYFAYGRAYIRVADEDRLMSARELEKFILARNREGARWDNQPGDLKLRDMDAGRLTQFLNKAGLRKGIGKDSRKNMLEKLGVIKDGRLLQAASLFFAKNPPVQLRCAVFTGRTSAHFLDQHDFEGDVLELIDEAQKYILKNIRIGMKLNGFVREDVPEISMEALRETIINAFCHRDWREPDHVRVAIYPDRVEIRSPGGLPDGLTVPQLRQGGISCRRNPLIADLLRRVHLVEAWGRGMPLILEKAPQTEFEDAAGMFISRFVRKEQSESGPESGPESRLESRLESPLAAKVLLLLNEEERGKAFLAQQLGHKTVSGELHKQVRRMLDLKLIEYTIPDKPNSRLQKYRLTGKGKALLKNGE